MWYQIFVKISSSHTVAWLLAALLLVRVASAHAQAPSITSPLSVSGAPGDFISYRITATGNPISYEAITVSPSLEIETMDPETGEIGLRVLADTLEETAIVLISATDESDETGEAELTVNIQQGVNPENSGPLAMEASIAIERPQIKKQDYELVSKFLLKGKVHRQLEERETNLGTYEAGLLSERVSNRTALEQMVESGEITAIEGYTLAMVGPLDGEPELVAISRASGEAVPVPTAILELVRGEKIGSYKWVENAESETIYAHARGFQPIAVFWMKDRADALTLRGLCKYKTSLRFTDIDGGRESYYEETLSGKVSGPSVETAPE